MTQVPERLKKEMGELKGVTEVFITHVSPEKVDAFSLWTTKIRNIEAQFPGYRGTYLQPPKDSQGENWITLLQFDTMENLERWLTSDERKVILQEGQAFICSLESHRISSPFAGWFSMFSKIENGVFPPVWKQTMLVLLVLFPLVMLEFKFLLPITYGFNQSLGTFIGNAISVALVSWPMMPFVIWLLNWWLAPQAKNKKNEYWISLAGTALVGLLYCFEVVAFWNFV